MNEAQRQQLSQQFAEFAAKLEQGRTAEDSARARKILADHARRKPVPERPDSAQLALPLS